jgi:5'-methylthioadenosine phosphorylase
MTDVELAVIGGSGLYDMAGLTQISQLRPDTPFGAPSDDITIGTLHGHRVAFLPRHGRGHLLTPGEVPYCANIYALKLLGVRYVISVSACGSLRERYAPGNIVIPDQLVDFTKGIRQRTFYGRGLVAHVSVANPFSPELSRVLAASVEAVGGTTHRGGTFITIEGPRFSTKGESELYRRWGMDIIGMTTSPEAFLAAEAEMAYACMAHVTDYDVWHETEEPVTVDKVIQVLAGNTQLAQAAISHLVHSMDKWGGEFYAHNALKDALITDRNRIPAETREQLGPLVAKYLSDE